MTRSHRGKVLSAAEKDWKQHSAPEAPDNRGHPKMPTPRDMLQPLHPPPREGLLFECKLALVA